MSYGYNDVVRILMRRDKMTKDEAEELLGECMQQVADGEDPEEVLHNELGLEPDYVWALLT